MNDPNEAITDMPDPEGTQTITGVELTDGEVGDETIKDVVEEAAERDGAVKVGDTIEDLSES